ncbi:ArnT family glycosyltransferase [Parasediminibacterium sp. JCM 36343]|uniref:ArnT family glycosyltransferase n=1 Tax=Parasediminibacterium sp. JCM 36343 TaxID=3374279 RepID=UPI00397863EA
MEKNYKKHLLLLTIIAAAIKIIVACLVELGNDEVYYWTYALQPDYNHFDHPPMVGLLIRLTSLNLHWASGLSLRLGAIIGCGISTYFIFQTGKLIANEKTAWYTALVYNCSVYSGFIAGMFILPDSPQMPFWTGALYLMAQIIVLQKDKQLSYWLGLGLTIGLACLCKVHGLYLWVGFGLFILLQRIKWLLNWRLYLGVAVTLLCVIPIVYWNVQNDFITYKFHSERVEHTVAEWDNLLQEIIGELAYQNPVVYILIIVAVIYFIRNKTIFPKPINAWLLCMGLPMILFFWGIALFNASLPHWSGPGYIPLYFIAAAFLAAKSNTVYPLFIKIAGGIVLFVLIGGIALARFAPFNVGSKHLDDYGEYCPTLDISGWEDFGEAFNTLVKKDIATGTMKKDAPIVAANWFPAGHELFYVARVTGQPLLGIGKLTEIHKFAWLNETFKPLQLGDDAYCIVPSNAPLKVAETYSKYFTTIEPPTIINQIRGGKMVRYFKIYRLRQCRQLPPPVLQ